MQIAEAGGHPPTIAMAKQAWIRVLLSKGEHALVASEAKQMLELSERFGIQTRIANAWMFLGRASIALGEVEAGMVSLRKGYDLWTSAGGKQQVRSTGRKLPTRCCVRGEATRRGSSSPTRRPSRRRPTSASTRPSCCGFAAGVWRSMATMPARKRTTRTRSPSPRNAALKLFSLRAACDLGRLWQRQGNCTEASRMLQPIYGWFTEGFQFTDLREAKALLDSQRPSGFATTAG